MTVKTKFNRLKGILLRPIYDSSTGETSFRFEARFAVSNSEFEFMKAQKRMPETPDGCEWTFWDDEG